MSGIILELECMTGKLISGSTAPVVYELLKATEYKPELLSYLKEAANQNADKPEKSTVTDEKDDNRASLQKWMSDRGKPVAVRGFSA
jgi:hypothetical protein